MSEIHVVLDREWIQKVQCSFDTDFTAVKMSIAKERKFLNVSLIGARFNVYVLDKQIYHERYCVDFIFDCSHQREKVFKCRFDWC